MDWQRIVLGLGIGVTLWLLVQEYSAFEAERRSGEPSIRDSLIVETIDEMPVVASDNSDSELPQVSETDPAAVAAPVTSRLISVVTDEHDIRIDPRGGDIVYAALREHLTELDESGDDYVLLNNTSANIYVAMSGLVGRDGTDTSAGRPLFSSASDSYVMAEGDDTLVVNLEYSNHSINYTKQFVFTRNHYEVEVRYLIDNQSEASWRGNFYGQIKRDSHPPLVESSGVRPFLGAAITTNDDKYRKFSFDDIEDESVKESLTGGWVAMVQHYFLSAWVPPQDEVNQFSLRKAAGKDLYFLGFTSPVFEIAPGAKGQYTAKYFIGPKDQDALEALSENLDMTVDYGWLWFLAKPFFLVLRWIHDLVGNWGWAIILFTVAIKAVLYPLSRASMRSMANMRKLGPEMQRLKELYGDDRQKMSQEMMGLYKKHKVNPAGGCLPMLLQMPVFLALYWVLLESVEIRHAPWVLWIEDLSSKDPLFILPLFMGASMWFMQKMQPTPPDPMQAKVMQIMPIAFTFFFMIFPAGLVLYWTVNNLLSMLQQYIVNKQIEAEGK